MSTTSEGLVALAESVAKLAEAIEARSNRDKIKADAIAAASVTPISKLGLTYRTQNCLCYDSIRTLDDLLSRTAEDLLEIRNFGKTCLRDVERALAMRGLHLLGEGPEELVIA